jgi:hypothetical protein
VKRRSAAGSAGRRAQGHWGDNFEYFRLPSHIAIAIGAFEATASIWAISSQPACQERPHRSREPDQRKRAEPPHLRRPGGGRCGLVEALARGPRLPLAQARRPELQRADLRQPRPRRRRRDLQPHLVPSQSPPGRRMSASDTARPERSGRVSPARPSVTRTNQHELSKGGCIRPTVL